MSITVIIPTFNEALHIERCLSGVVGWADRVVVVDSYSCDDTPTIVSDYADRGVEFVQHPYAGPADQKNWALDELDIDTEWVLFLDADELVTPGLRAAMDEVASRSGGADGYFVNRRILWYGKWIKRGGWFPNWNLRFFRTGRARYEMRRVHEHMIVDGDTAYLGGWLDHEDLRDMTFSIDKHNRYSNAEAREYLDASVDDDYARLFSRDRLSRKRWIKMKIWSRLPGKALWYFVWAYIVRLGFLDGMHGLRFHAMHAMYKQFDELKLWELRNSNQKSGSNVVCTNRSPTNDGSGARSALVSTGSQSS